jgi:ubiquinone/menaquinone biosynthesis C-methylase UbiE
LITAQQLYEHWADEDALNEALGRSLEPRGLDSLFAAFAALGPQPGERLLDLGARDAKHAIRLEREHGLHVTALDPLPLHCELARAAVAEAGASVEVVEGRAEELLFPDGSFDWIWCRDVLLHVDAVSGLAECARVLEPGGSMLAYVTLATEQLEPRERQELVDSTAIKTFDADVLEAAAREAGLEARSVDPLGSEWREAMAENGDWSPTEDLLHIARLRRGGREGPDAQAAWAGLVWGIYQLLGKLCPTVYVWSKTSSA